MHRRWRETDLVDDVGCDVSQRTGAGGFPTQRPGRGRSGIAEPVLQIRGQYMPDHAGLAPRRLWSAFVAE
ncbi:hypothetical protein ABIE18_004377 [Arthrobacter sp. 2762]